MNSKKMVYVICALLLLGIAVYFGGGSGNKQPASQSAVPAASVKDSLVVALSMEPQSLDPKLVSQRIQYLAMMQLYDRLVYEDDDRNIQPALAESWEISDDSLSYIFKIRRGVKFHNGKELTTEDVAFSVNRVINEFSSKLFSSAFKNMEIIDNDHVKLNLKYPFSPALYCLNHANFSILPKAYLEEKGADFGRAPVGTGPFKFTSWLSGDNVVLERFDDYWQGPARLKKITYKMIVDLTTSVLALENGEIDLMSSVPESSRMSIINNPNLVWHETGSGFVYMVTFNNQKGLFTNEKLRQAVAYAINKEDLVLGALEGNGVRLDAPFAKFVFGYPDPSEFTPIEQDLDKAKALLAEAGYPNGLSVTLRVAEQANVLRPAEIVQDQLRKIGITVNIETMERGTYTSEVYRDMKYEMSVWNMTSDYPDADSPAYTRMHSSLIGNTNNYTGTNIPELDKALDTGRFSSDQAERKAAYLKVAELTRDHVPFIPLYSPMNNMVCNKNLKGVKAHYGQTAWMYDYYWAE